MPFAKALPPGTFSFACQKRTRKAPATFEAREARTRGCSPLVTPKMLGSIQKIQAAALKDFLCSADWKPLSRCATAPPSGSKRTRKLCGLPGNFPAMPKPPSMREVASRSDDGRSLYLNYSFSRTSRGSSLKEGASGETGKLCGLPRNFAAMPRTLPLRKDFPRPGEDVA